MGQSEYWVGQELPKCEKCNKVINLGEKFFIGIECEVTNDSHNANMYDEDAKFFGVETGDGWDPYCKKCLS